MAAQQHSPASAGWSRFFVTVDALEGDRLCAAHLSGAIEHRAEAEAELERFRPQYPHAYLTRVESFDGGRPPTAEPPPRLVSPARCIPRSPRTVGPAALRAGIAAGAAIRASQEKARG